MQLLFGKYKSGTQLADDKDFLLTNTNSQFTSEKIQMFMYENSRIDNEVARLLTQNLWADNDELDSTDMLETYPSQGVEGRHYSEDDNTAGGHTITTFSVIFILSVCAVFF